MWRRLMPAGRLSGGVPYAYVAAAGMLVALLSMALLPVADIGHSGVLFLLVVVWAGVRYGLGPALFAVAASAVLINYFFIWPPLGFDFRNTQYWMTFLAMLSVSVLVGHLTAGLRSETMVARQRERQAESLSAFARQLSAAIDAALVVRSTQAVLGELFRARVAVLLPDPSGVLDTHADLEGIDAAMARRAFSQGAGMDAWSPVAAGGSVFHYLPLQAPGGTYGVLVLCMQASPARSRPGVRHEMDAFARLIGIAMERIRLMEVAQEMRMKATAESLRNSVLAALSHDLRTPLAGLIGLVDTLMLVSPPASEQGREIADEIRASAGQMSGLVNDLLELARIQAGGVRLRRGWESLEEIAGSALRLLQQQLAGHPVRVDIPQDFPLVHVDALLCERVVANLVENAVRHSPPAGEIRIDVRLEDGAVVIAVADSGTGLSADEIARFAQSAQRDADDALAGGGLGLAICRAFVAAHGGVLSAANRPGGGAVVSVTLPAVLSSTADADLASTTDFPAVPEASP